jgi:hypothetical protein
MALEKADRGPTKMAQLRSTCAVHLLQKPLSTRSGRAAEKFKAPHAALECKLGSGVRLANTFFNVRASIALLARPSLVSSVK